MKPIEYFIDGGEQIVIDIPQDMQGKRLKVVVTETEENVKKFHELPVKDRLKILQQFKGSAKFPEVQIDKYDVYDQ
ncbi:MAG TPA: hypothetical protein VF623_08690 [Segetibacter sp.]